MHIEYSAFILPHIGDKYSQCADRFSCGETNQCFAIADGVGNSLFPSDWATLLCNDFIKNPISYSENSHLIREDELIMEWEERRNTHISNLTDDERFIYEMGLDKADFAAATFVGLSLDEKEWRCQAIGDSYLFIVDSSFNILKKVASMDGKDFDNFPEYYASKKDKNNGTVVEYTGDYQGVAYIALMTDALSDWFIDASPTKRENLLKIRNHSDYESFIDNERQVMAIKDDDTTMVVLKIEQDGNDMITLHSEFDQIDKIDELILNKKNNTAVNDVTEASIIAESINSKGEEIENEIVVAEPCISNIKIEIEGGDIDKIRRIERKYKNSNKSNLKFYIKDLLSIIKKYVNYGTSH